MPDLLDKVLLRFTQDLEVADISDERLIRRAIAMTRRERIGKDRFEFQMLFGVRRDLQDRLVAAGYTVRVYVPFGREWYPYFMRRLAERPANLAFVLRSVLKERSRGGAR